MFGQRLRRLEIVRTIHQHLAPLQPVDAQAARPAHTIECRLNSGWLERRHQACVHDFESQRQGKLEVVNLKGPGKRHPDNRIATVPADRDPLPRRRPYT